MTDIVVIAVVGLILGLVIGYICKEKKKGTVCIGCPHAASCGKKCSQDTCSGCSGKKQ